MGMRVRAAVRLRSAARWRASRTLENAFQVIADDYVTMTDGYRHRASWLPPSVKTTNRVGREHDIPLLSAAWITKG